MHGSAIAGAAAGYVLQALPRLNKCPQPAAPAASIAAAVKIISRFMALLSNRWTRHILAKLRVKQLYNTPHDVQTQRPVFFRQPARLFFRTSRNGGYICKTNPNVAEVETPRRPCAAVVPDRPRK